MPNERMGLDKRTEQLLMKALHINVRMQIKALDGERKEIENAIKIYYNIHRTKLSQNPF